jgi:formamidopyrimidine-DNA glycosylase
MPEGPNVREYYLYIKPLLTDKIIKKMTILSGKYLEKKPIKNIEKIICKKIKSIFVKGKTIFLEFEKTSENSPIGMSFVHGMTGYWSDELEKHSRLCIELLCGNRIYYNDMRNFGLINVFTCEIEFEFAQTRLGPDILSDCITYDQFYSRLNKKPRSRLGIVLLDQKVLAGIGNYLRCDILWYIRKVCGFENVTHERLVGSLTDDEKVCLYEVTINMCRYRADLNNELKLYSDDFYVYGKDYDIYGNKVERVSFGARTVHYVL